MNNENPYRPDDNNPASSGRNSTYSYFVASLGALFVFVGAFLAIAILPGYVVPDLYLNRLLTGALFLTGLILAALAAVGSFRSTLRAYARKNQ